MRFCAVECALPSRMVTNEDLIQAMSDASRHHLCQSELTAAVEKLRQLLQASRTKVRYHRAPGEHAYQFVVEAGQRALRNAKLSPDEIDLVIYVGVGRGFIEPSTANVFQDLLKLKNATCFDIVDACMSWLRAVDVARAMMATGVYKRVMIINGEFSFHEYGNLELKSVEELAFKYPTFTMGEAATATILSPSEEDDEYFTEFRTWGSQRNLCMIPLGNFTEYAGCEIGNHALPLEFFSFGERLLRTAFPRICRQYRDCPEINQFSSDIIFTHAVSDGMTHKLLETCNIDTEKAFYVHARFGNTVSASVPLGLAVAAREGRLKHNDRILLIVASAGISTAWSRFRYLTGSS